MTAESEVDASEAKRQEWEHLLSQGHGVITPDKFLENAKRKDSAFHGDYTWDAKEAAKQYYEKRTACLITLYSTIFNTTTATQRLYGVVPKLKKSKGKPYGKKHYKTAAAVAERVGELDQVREAIWSRLRRVVRDMYDFREYLPEFKEILNFLLPRVKKS